MRLRASLITDVLTTGERLLTRSKIIFLSTAISIPAISISRIRAIVKWQLNSWTRPAVPRSRVVHLVHGPPLCQ